MTSRRAFVKNIGLGFAATSFAPYFKFVEARSYPFKLCLNPGAIGVSLSNDELLKAAKVYNFQAIVPQINELEDWSPTNIKAFKEALLENGITLGAVGLPIQFRQSQSKFDSDYKRLVELLPKLSLLGVQRMSTWIMPTHAELNYEQNMALHTIRLRKVARLLGDFNIKLGLEYVGPKTLRESQQYPFVSSLKEVKELINVIGEDNAGVQLDAFHWYCASESKKDLLSLSPEEIITVDLNDAKAGRSRDEQLDWERELPGASGVIDLKSFLNALVEIGYDGPVRAEPFNAKLNDMENAAALKATREAMEAAIQLID